MKLKITLDDKHYKSDNIQYGRIAKKFFQELSMNVFDHSYKHWKKSLKLTESGEIPILYNERNLYSTFAVAIDKITPIHLSEWSFNPSDHENIDRSKIVDLWCLNQDGETGQPLNYFIEIKKGGYNLNEASYLDFQERLATNITEVVEQITNLKKINKGWDYDDVFLGISIIHGSYKDGKEYYNTKDVRDNLYDLIDKRHHAELLISTWHLPDDMEVQWESKKCRFISIAGIVVTKKRQ